jgi:Protein of unknown function (DUF3754)
VTEVDAGRFIPFRRSDVVEMCIDDGGLADVDQAGFRELARMVGAVIHQELTERLEQIKDAYAPWDPNRDTVAVREFEPEERAELQRRLVVDLTEVLHAANYERIDMDAVRGAVGRETLLQVRLHVDLDDFEEILFFRRGETVHTETLRRWFGLRREPIEFLNYERVLVYVKFKPEEHFTALGRELDDLRFRPGSMMLKLFRNIPQGDLESLFPNSEVRMRPIDKLALGVPALASGLVVLFTKLGAALGLVFLFVGFHLGLRDSEPDFDHAALALLAGGLSTLGLFGWRQWSKFENRKIRFLKLLTEHLYFRNLDNDAGVLHHLADAAEEEETKEALVAYYFTLVASAPISAVELDGRIERWFAQRWQTPVDFEVADGLAKLERLGLASSTDGGWTVCPPAEACRVLDTRWDAVFEHARPAGRADSASNGDGSDGGGRGGPGSESRPRSLRTWARWQLGRVRSRLGDRATDDRAADA